jgi:hypothetical protein
MKKLRTLIFALLAWLSPIAAAIAQQSAPNWSYGYTPTPAEWNHWFAVKSDWPGSASCLLTGCTFTGPVFTAPASSLGAGFNVGQGTTPSSPNNGDIWITGSGIFAQFGGSTYTLTSTASGTTGQVGTFTGPSAIGGLAGASADLAIGYWTAANTAATTAIPNCTTALLYSTSLHQFSCSAGTAVSQPQGRLTLQANTPVMTTSQTGQATLRYDCYNGNSVPYYNGTLDQPDTIASCEVTDAMVSTASAGQVVSGQVYDVWWVHTGANRICIAMSTSGGAGGGWAQDGGSATTRGTTFTVLDRSTRGFITNKNAIANCFNGATNYGPVSANQGTYLGTVYATANGQTSYTFGAAAANGSAGLFGVWNMYNRVATSSIVIDTSATYTYNTAAVRQFHGSAQMQTQFVIGIAEDGVQASMNNRISTLAVVNASNQWGIGLDTTAAFSCARAIGGNSGGSAGSYGFASVCAFNPQLGFHTISANEQGDGTNANVLNVNSDANLSVTLRN